MSKAFLSSTQCFRCDYRNISTRKSWAIHHYRFHVEKIEVLTSSRITGFVLSGKMTIPIVFRFIFVNSIHIDINITWAIEPRMLVKKFWKERNDWWFKWLKPTPKWCKLSNKYRNILPRACIISCTRWNVWQSPALISCLPPRMPGLELHPILFFPMCM